MLLEGSMFELPFKNGKVWPPNLSFSNRCDVLGSLANSITLLEHTIEEFILSKQVVFFVKFDMNLPEIHGFDVHLRKTSEI